MKITVIGWYGTETIGDRAILAGLISFFNKSFDSFEVYLGSLYPFFSERTINEDYSYYKEMIGCDFKIDIFNSKDSSQLVQAIKNSDLVVMGGGPLMDLDELFLVEYAFKKARKLGKKTAILGCGIGPLFQKKYRKSVLEIVKVSDQVVLRDTASKENFEEICLEFKCNLNKGNIKTSYDPAVECVLQYSLLADKNRSDYIAVNLREFPLEYSKNTRSADINNNLKKFIARLAERFSEHETKLIPMHYFHVGGDDRVFLNSIAKDLNLENISVQNVNLTLKETIEIYQNAYFNVGMRFHSVVLQTVSSGYNYVLDYTEPKKGKIFGFLKDIDDKLFYQDRYISLQQDAIDIKIITNVNSCFELQLEDVTKHLSIYPQILKQMLA